MKKATCANCKHFRPREEDISEGACRRYPPSLVHIVELEETTTAFPLTTSDMYCGEFTHE